MVPLLMREVIWEAVVLFAALVLRPVRLVCVAIFGVSTTKEERDLSFIFAGNVLVGSLEVSTFVSGGNTLYLIL